MKKLIFIIGESGSGKDTAVGILRRYGYEGVPSYTTRSKREGECNYVEHIFLKNICNPRVWARQRGTKVFAETIYGGEYYFTTERQIEERMEEGGVAYVIDEAGFMDLKVRGIKYPYILLYIYRDEALRLQSGVSEERMRRDRKRGQILLDEMYDYKICNNGSIHDLEVKLKRIVHEDNNRDIQPE